MIQNQDDNPIVEEEVVKLTEEHESLGTEESIQMNINTQPKKNFLNKGEFNTQSLNDIVDNQDYPYVHTVNEKSPMQNRSVVTNQSKIREDKNRAIQSERMSMSSRPSPGRQVK